MADDADPAPGRTIELSVLDADPERAERRYRELRRDLIRFLEWLGCGQPEDAADEALFRGLTRIASGADTSRGGVRGFVFGVAKLVAKERARVHQRERAFDTQTWALQPSGARDHDSVDARLTLVRTLKTLSRHDRRILIRYYGGDDHGPLSRELGVTPGHLRLIVHRIRQALRARLDS